MKDASVTIARLTDSTDVDDVISIDIKIPGQKLKLRLSLEDLTLALTGRSEVPAEVKYNRVLPEIPQPHPSRKCL